jgi:hypothetical protein
VSLLLAARDAHLASERKQQQAAATEIADVAAAKAEAAATKSTAVAVAEAAAKAAPICGVCLGLGRIVALYYLLIHFTPESLPYSVALFLK